MNFVLNMENALKFLKTKCVYFQVIPICLDSLIIQNSFHRKGHILRLKLVIRISEY